MQANIILSEVGDITQLLHGWVPKQIMGSFQRSTHSQKYPLVTNQKRTNWATIRQTKAQYCLRPYTFETIPQSDAW